MHGGYVERSYGPLFWLFILFLICTIINSLYIIYSALISNATQRIKKQVTHVLKGVLVLTVFVLLDVFLNVVLFKSQPVIPGMTSLGILISAIFFVIAIHRDKIFDLVTIAHQDIIDTLTLGILVLDDNETVVEINRSLLPKINLQIGDRFDLSALTPWSRLPALSDCFNIHILNSPWREAKLKYSTPRSKRTSILQRNPLS